MKQIIMLIAGLWCFYASAQTDSTAVDSTAPAKSTFTLGAVYANNASYYGQSAAETNPYIALAATYRFKSGFYLSGLAYRLLKDTGGLASAGSAGAGWDIKLGKRWSADLSYSHTFYPSYSPFLQAANPDNASLSLSYENWLTVKLTGDYAFGKTSDAFSTAGISKSVNLGSFSKKDVVSINPSFDVVAGTQHFYQTYITEKRVHDSLMGLPLGSLFGSPGTTTSSSKTVSTIQFNLLSYNFKLPLAYSRSRYMVELAWQYSVLSEYAQSQPGKSNSFFTFGFYYQF